MAAKRVLFSGYAPVHFLCYLPVYQLLRDDPDLDLFLSGGFRDKSTDPVSYHLEGFYDPFPIESRHVVSNEQVLAEDFDVVVCAHLSDALFPRSQKRTVQIFHGVSFKNLAVREKALAFDYLCLPGRYHAELFEKQGLVRDDGRHYLLTGFPKADSLVSPGFDRQALLADVGLDPELPTALLAPTGDKQNALETMGEDVIGEIASCGLWNLMVKPHDHPKNPIDWFERLAPLEGDRVRVIRDRDVVPYLRAADVLMTDASSVAVEYTLLQRPIIFLDVPKLLKKVQKRAPALDLDTYGRKIGTIVKRPSELVAALAAARASTGEEVALRNRMAQHVFHRPGGSAERVASVIRHAAGLTDEFAPGVEVVRSG